jgi:hypothetical protein
LKYILRHTPAPKQITVLFDSYTLTETYKGPLKTKTAGFFEISDKKIVSLPDVKNKRNHRVVNLAIYVQQSSSYPKHVLWGDTSCRPVGAYRLRNMLSHFQGTLTSAVKIDVLCAVTLWAG